MSLQRTVRARTSHQPRDNLVKDEKDDLFADFHVKIGGRTTLLLNVHTTSDVGQI
jgi:hypothetical protein